MEKIARAHASLDGVPSKVGGGALRGVPNSSSSSQHQQSWRRRRRVRAPAGPQPVAHMTMAVRPRLRDLRRRTRRNHERAMPRGRAAAARRAIGPRSARRARYGGTRHDGGAKYAQRAQWEGEGGACEAAASHPSSSTAGSCPFINYVRARGRTTATLPDLGLRGSRQAPRDRWRSRARARW